MTLAISTFAVAVVLALVLVAARTARSSRRQDTWVCRLCEEGFSEMPAAEAHLMAVHHRTP